ncbi:MAG: hypothetical protein D6801_05890 [Alphaproteobacteria bacterium]|nr:MAG: hypothetical protein D6801_05890 [Alphaproteobacteria bacterium]
MPASPAPRFLHRGPHLEVSLRGDSAESLLVTFDHWRHDKAGFTEMPGETGYSRGGHTHLHISTSANDWFLNPDMPKALLKIARFAEGFSRRAALAFSMGGFGALLVSRVVAFDRVLLVSPHATWSPDDPPHDDRYHAEVRDAAFARAASDMVHASLKMDAECVILLDSTSPFDSDHAAAAARLFTRARLVDLKGGGHPATDLLKQAGRFGLVPKALLADRIDESRIVETHYKLRAARQERPLRS